MKNTSALPTQLAVADDDCARSIDQLSFDAVVMSVSSVQFVIRQTLHEVSRAVAAVTVIRFLNCSSIDGASVAAVAGVTPSHVSASTELAVTVAPAYGLDKVATRLSIIDNVGVVSRLPQIKATPETATELNKTAPKLTCVGSAGTVTVNGEYASEDGVLTMIFVFASAPSVDKCTLSNTTYVQPTGDTVYPFTAAAKAELFGDPAKILDAANKRLKSAVPALRKSYQGSWSTGAAKRVDAALTKYSVKPALFAFEASSTSPKSMYILRPDNHTVRWVHLCQRLTDGRLACLRYNPVTNKSKLWVNYDSPNYFTQDLTRETASA